MNSDLGMQALSQIIKLSTMMVYLKQFFWAWGFFLATNEWGLKGGREKYLSVWKAQTVHPYIVSLGEKSEEPTVAGRSKSLPGPDIWLIIEIPLFFHGRTYGRNLETCMPEARLLLCSITMLLAVPQKLAVPQTNGVLVCSHKPLSQSSWQGGHCHVLSASLLPKVAGLADSVQFSHSVVADSLWPHEL